MMYFFRKSIYQPDVIFMIVQVPEDWTPETVFDIPPASTIVSELPVASFEEACDDLIRCNRIALSNGLREWAVIEMAEAEA